MTLTLSKSEEARILRDRTRKTRQREAKAVRPKSPKADRGRVTDKTYLAWLRRQPCAARALGGCEGPIESAHVRFSRASTGRVNPGMQKRPSDEFAVPLCASHHRTGPLAQHSMNEARFWSMVGEDVDILMASLRQRFTNPGANP